MADQSGMSLEASIDSYAWNDNFAVAVAQIREANPEAFTMAEIVDVDDAWVAFAGDVPDGAFDIITGFSSANRGVSVDVQPGWGYTEAALEHAIEDVHFAVLDTPGVRDATTTFDSATGGITTTVVPTSDVATAALVDLRALARESLATSMGQAASKLAIKPGQATFLIAG